MMYVSILIAPNPLRRIQSFVHIADVRKRFNKQIDVSKRMIRSHFLVIFNYGYRRIEQQRNRGKKDDCVDNLPYHLGHPKLNTKNLVFLSG